MSPYDQDARHFQLLQKVSESNEYIHSFQPSDIDKLGVEISKAFQRASVPESTVAREEREVNEVMLGCIGTIDYALSLKKGTGRVGAMLMLYRRTIVTPDNLQALFRMCDSSIRTGKVRCHAFWHLKTLRSLESQITVTTWQQSVDFGCWQVDYPHVGSSDRNAPPLR
jgi:hypothetical protein